MKHLFTTALLLLGTSIAAAAAPNIRTEIQECKIISQPANQHFNKASILYQGTYRTAQSYILLLDQNQEFWGDTKGGEDWTGFLHYSNQKVPHISANKEDISSGRNALRSLQLKEIKPSGKKLSAVEGNAQILTHEGLVALNLSCAPN